MGETSAWERLSGRGEELEGLAGASAFFVKLSWILSSRRPTRVLLDKSRRRISFREAANSSFVRLCCSASLRRFAFEVGH